MKLFLPALCLLVTACLGLPDLPALASGNTDMAAGDSGTNTDTDDTSSDATTPADAGDSGDSGDGRDGGDGGDGGDTWLQLTTGESHVCALHRSGEIYCWGRGYLGQLGLGDTEPRTMPTLVSRPPMEPTISWDAIAAGDSHTCAVGDGNVYCWGQNQGGQVSNEGGQKNSPTLYAFSMAEMLSTGDSAGIGAGVAHSCALRANGQGRCWGLDSDSRLGSTDGVVQGASAATPLRTIALGETFGCGLADLDSSVLCWGDLLGGEGRGLRSIAPGAHTSLSVGIDHGCAVTSAGEVTCFGSNGFSAGSGVTYKLGTPDLGPAPDNALGQPTVVENLSGVTAVAAGWNHTCAVSGVDLKVTCWGQNVRGEAGLPGTAFGSATLNTIETLRGVTAIAAGGRFTCAIADGEIHCWGSNSFGELGRGDGFPMDSENNHEPAPVEFP